MVEGLGSGWRPEASKAPTLFEGFGLRFLVPSAHTLGWQRDTSLNGKHRNNTSSAKIVMRRRCKECSYKRISG